MDADLRILMSITIRKCGEEELITYELVVHIATINICNENGQTQYMLWHRTDFHNAK